MLFSVGERVVVVRKTGSLHHAFPVGQKLTLIEVIHHPKALNPILYDCRNEGSNLTQRIHPEDLELVEPPLVEIIRNETDYA